MSGVNTAGGSALSPAALAAGLDATGMRFDTPERHGYVAGTTADACASIIAAGNALSAAGGGVLLLGPRTYTLGTPQESAGVLIPAFPANVCVMGWGDGTVLKVANGLNGVGTTFEVFSTNVAALASTRIYGAQFVGFKIDFNGANNLVPQSQPGKANQGVRLAHCQGVRVQSVTFANNPGRQCVCIGANDSAAETDGAGVVSMVPGSFDIKILGCSFLEMGSAVTGNVYQTDHSSIYINADQPEVAHNVFRNTVVGNREMTAIEMHSTRGSVNDNTVVNFSHPINVAAQICDHFGMKYHHNVGYNCRIGLFFGTSSTFQLRDCDFEDNTFQTDVGNQNMVELGASIMAGSVYATNLTFKGNTFICTAGVTSLLTGCFNISKVAKLTVNDNRIQGFSGRALEIAINPTDNVLDIEWNRNTIVDCGQTSNASYREAMVLNTTSVIKRWRANGNRIFNSGAGRISIAGTFHTGDVITVTIGGVAIQGYTVLSGDSNLQGVTQGLASFLNLDPTFLVTYLAEARGTDVVISTLVGGTSTTLTVAVTGASNSITATVAASPFITYMTKAFVSNAPINDGEMLDNDIEGLPGSYSFTNAGSAVFVHHRGVGTPNNVIAAAQGSTWLDRNSQTLDRYVKKGSLAISAGWRLERTASALPANGTYSQGDAIDSTAPVSAAGSGWHCTTSGGRAGSTTTTWTNGVSYVYGQWVKASNGRVYSVVTAGGGAVATGSEPSHTIGTAAAGADGYVWFHRNAAAALFAVRANLGTAA